MDARRLAELRAERRHGGGTLPKGTQMSRLERSRGRTAAVRTPSSATVSDDDDGLAIARWVG